MGRVNPRIALALAVLVWLWPAPAGAQCAMCRLALHSPEGQRMIAAFQSGIVILLAAPVSLVGVIATLVVRMQRRRAREGS